MHGPPPRRTVAHVPGAARDHPSGGAGRIAPVSAVVPDEPHVSIVIPCFNYGRFLAEAISSALGQSHAPLEVIVVDDGSTDSSVEVAGRFAPAVSVVTQQNQGVAAARNLGL